MKNNNLMLRLTIASVTCALLLVAIVTGVSAIAAKDKTAATLTDPVRIETGLLTGTAADKDGIRVYKGIPYAAPPTGEWRWRAPQPPAAWPGVKAFDEFGPACPQAPYPAGSIYAGKAEKQSEDCLCLNVWTGAAKANEKRPVMVWIHGGALTRGSGSNTVYDGSSFATKGVVLVTINYRLGAFGYFAHPALSAESPHKVSGNYGTLDQIAALKWVQRNIAAFGGDPNNVTIFGESAGSWSVNALVASPLAKGLFHRAIGESGGVFAPMQFLKEARYGNPSAEDAGKAFAKALGVSDGPDALKELRAKSAEEILAAFEKARGAARGIVDGRVFPDEVQAIFAAGRHNDVPVIVGSNADEATAFVNPATMPKTLAAYKAFLKTQYGDRVADFLKVYAVNSEADISRSLLAGFRDQTFTWQMRMWARMTGRGKAKAYLYFFSRVPPRPDRERYGAYHAAEIAYAFDNLQRTKLQPETPDTVLSAAMSNYWVNFARTGNPNQKGLPTWPAYNAKDEPYLELGDTIKAGNHLLKAECDFYEAWFAARRANP